LDPLHLLFQPLLHQLDLASEGCINRLSAIHTLLEFIVAILDLLPIA
jgi:hypothetical protein